MGLLPHGGLNAFGRVSRRARIVRAPSEQGVLNANEIAVPAVTFEDWMFSIHLLFAATLVGSLVMSWIVVVSMRTADTPDATLSLHRVAMVATGATIVGLVGAIAFGLWLAVLRTAFHPWDGWVIAAIVLWIIAT